MIDPARLESLRQRAMEIGDAALDQDGPERDSFISRECGGDADLRELVLQYVRDGDAISVDPVIREPEPYTYSNRQIGAWKLLRRLGEGGFGIVYLVERSDGQVRQLGAMKFLKGTVREGDLEIRFLDERQILANLNHPWIVHLIDVGVSSDGQPYLVMEYVDDALPIDAYCRERALSIDDRLRLFLQVCEAVSYAHRKLVVHRDLKPSNILVTKEGVPRLLDFGVAKILDPAHRGSIGAAASTNVLLGTERYFSPEQARREPVDTTSDVYALGVILYELLTGTDPYGLDARPKESVEHIICMVEPEPPSKAVARIANREDPVIADGGGRASASKLLTTERLARELRGDLDNIILMALRKEPQRRYASADHFAAEIRRYIDGLPVHARPDTYAYRASKFVHRNKLGVAAAAMVVLSLLAGLIATIWQARRAQAEQAIAERRFQDVRKLADTYLFEFHDEVAKLPGTTKVRGLIVLRALEYLGDLAKESSGDRELQLELATAYQKVGDAQGRPGFANIGDRTGALASYRQALAIRTALGAGSSADPKLRLDLATNYDRIADVLLLTGKSADALQNYEQAYPLRESLLAANRGNRVFRRDFATSCQRLAQALAQTGQLRAALEKQQRALTLFEELAADQSRDPAAQRDLFIAYVKEGDLSRASNDRTRALDYYQLALPIANAVEGIADDLPKARRETASVHDKIGNLDLANKDLSGAMDAYRAAFQIRETLAAADPNNAEAQRDLSISHEKIGTVLMQMNQPLEALAEHQQSLKLDEKLLARDPENAQSRLDCAGDYENIGQLWQKSGNLTAAIENEDQARRLREWVATKDEKNVDVRGDLALNYQQLGDLNASVARQTGDQARLAAASQSYQRALDLLRGLETHGSLDKDGAAQIKAIEKSLDVIAQSPKSSKK